jgi:hypothetical protein
MSINLLDVRLTNLVAYFTKREVLDIPCLSHYKRNHFFCIANIYFAPKKYWWTDTLLAKGNPNGI